MLKTRLLCLVVGCIFLMTSPVFSETHHIMEPRVPPDQLGEARSLTNPLSSSPDVVMKGKEIYKGKGACFNCHGMNGRGDGPGGATLTPPPRNFRHPGMWHHRTEGELFWVIKHGSAGTGMIGFGGMLSDEEIWSVLQFEQTFSVNRGRRGRGFGDGDPERRGFGRGRGRHGMGSSEGQHSGKGMDECCNARE